MSDTPETTLTLINLTSRKVTLLNDKDEVVKTFAPAKQPVPTIALRGIYNVSGISFRSLGEITGLPEENPGILYIISPRVFAASTRRDLVCAGRLVKAKNGQVKGYRELLMRPLPLNEQE